MIINNYEKIMIKNGLLINMKPHIFFFNVDMGDIGSNKRRRPP